MVAGGGRTTSAVITAVAAALGAEGTATVPQLMRRLRGDGLHRVPRRQVEQALEEDPRFVDDGDRTRPLWTLADGDAEVAAADVRATTTDTRRHLDALDLRAWQAEALATWSSTGRGVVEAVTGTGKTRLAMAAIRVVLDRGGRSLVLVPGLELQDQWVRELRGLVPGVRIGRLGGGADDDLFDHQVVVATPHSAAALPVDLPPGVPGLLVADEAHRYGAPTWSAALRPHFTLRLALTATYERSDDGLVDVLEPYFGGVVFRYRFDRAVAEGTVAPFRIALVGVGLTQDERTGYDAVDARARRLHGELVGGLGMPREPRRLLAAASAVVAAAGGGDGDGPQARACREYLACLRRRREIAAVAVAKLDVCRGIALAPRHRTLVFTDTVDQAEAAAAVLTGSGLSAATVHGGLRADRRRARLARFRRGEVAALLAPRVLDEGVDVPEADLAVVLAAFRTRRQMVQRLGRVLRVKGDGRAARLVIAHATGTLEDPARGGHDGFLAEVTGAAREVAHLEPGELAAWLDPAGIAPSVG